MDTLIKLYQTLFSIRKIPLLDVCYQLVNADLDTAMKDLLRVLETHSTLPSSKEDPGTNHRNLSPYEAQGAVVFDLAILSQLLTATKSAMGVSYCTIASTYQKSYFNWGTNSQRLLRRYPEN